MRDRRVVGPAGFTRLLLTRGERGQVPLPLARRPAPGGAPRLRWMAEAVKRDALGWLFRAGGWRRRTVVVGGRRREGRLTDEGIAERLDLRFGPAALRLLVAAMEDPPLPDVGAALGGDLATGDLVAVHRVASALAREALAGGEREVGPAALAAPLRQLRLALPACRRAWVVGADGSALATDEDAPEDPAWAEAVRQAVGRRAADETVAWRRLAPGVLLRPLEGAGRLWVACAVEPRAQGLRAARGRASARRWPRWRPRAAGGLPARGSSRRGGGRSCRQPAPRALSAEALGDEAGAPLGPLFAGDRAVLWSYLDQAVARAWLEEEADRRRAPAPDAQPRYAAAARGLAAFAAAATAADRPDALRPLLRFFLGHARRFGNRAPVVAALRERAQAFDRASERDAFLATVAGLFGACRLVAAQAERTLATPVIDRGEEEKVLLADWHDGFRGVADECEAIRRELAGEIG
ncbi:MAG: hypothetical protein KF878_34850 [Planctomycetes bacterium]|nr:hypothetical protein [Planctomycetota bacterium]